MFPRSYHERHPAAARRPRKTSRWPAFSRSPRSDVGRRRRRRCGAVPGLAPRLRDAAGKPYPFVTFYVNDDDARLQGGFAASVRDGDEIIIVPAIAGG